MVSLHPMLFLQIPLLLFAVYTLLACAIISRFDWSNRSVAVGGRGWINWPVTALLGLVVPGLAAFSAYSSGALPGISERAFLLLTGALHTGCALVMIRTAMGAQGYRGSDRSPGLWGIVFRLSVILALGPLLLVASLCMSFFVPGVLWIIFLNFLTSPAFSGRLAYRMAIGRGTFMTMPSSPLVSEIAAITTLSHDQGLRIRSDAGPVVSGKASDFGPALVRWLRWQHGRYARYLPKEFLTGISPESLTAAFAVTIHGLDEGFHVWRRAAVEGDAPRNLPAFFRALAQFDRFLLQPEDPAPLLRRYANSAELKRVALEFGTEEDYAQGMAAMREVFGFAPMPPQVNHASEQLNGVWGDGSAGS